MKKAVFFDIDGTLWDAKMQIPESTKVAIKRLRENGHYAFLCSGRAKAAIQSPKLFELGFDGVVAGCGTHIEFQGEKLFEQLLSERQVAYVLEILEEYGIQAILEGPEHLYMRADHFREDSFVTYLRNELGAFIREIGEARDIRCNKLSADFTGTEVKGACAKLEKEFELIFHNESVVELLPKGFTKASGIHRVCELLNIPKEHTYAFGDSANDLDMLQFVAHGVAMGNGTDSAKEVAEYITTEIHADGIAHGLEHYGLI